MQRFPELLVLISADTEVSVFLVIVAGALIPSILGFNIKSLNPYKSPGAAPGKWLSAMGPLPSIAPLVLGRDSPAPVFYE